MKVSFYLIICFPFFFCFCKSQKKYLEDLINDEGQVNVGNQEPETKEEEEKQLNVLKREKNQPTTSKKIKEALETAVDLQEKVVEKVTNDEELNKSLGIAETLIDAIVVEREAHEVLEVEGENLTSQSVSNYNESVAQLTDSIIDTHVSISLPLYLGSQISEKTADNSNSSEKIINQEESERQKQMLIVLEELRIRQIEETAKEVASRFIARRLQKTFKTTTQEVESEILQTMDSVFVFRPRMQKESDRAIIDSMINKHNLLSGAQELGSGGFGKTFLLTHNVNGVDKLFVIKQAHDTVDKEEIAKELAALDRIPQYHKNITKYYGAVKIGGKWSLVFEKAEGDLLKFNRPPSHATTKNLAFVPDIKHHLGVLDALKSIHIRGIAHRDLKFQNLLHVKGEGGTDLVKIADFGAGYSMGDVKHGRISTKGYVGQEIKTVSVLQHSPSFEDSYFKRIQNSTSVIEVKEDIKKLLDQLTRHKDIEESVFTVAGIIEPMTLEEKIQQIFNFVRNYDPRSSDVFAYGRILGLYRSYYHPNGHIQNGVECCRKHLSIEYIQKMKHPMPNMRPTIDEVITEINKLASVSN